MTEVLEKVQWLEHYIRASNGQADWVLESTIEKLVARERGKLRQQLARLHSHTAAFEARYGWTSDEFYPRFERGELGDDMDLIEWSATIEMIQNLLRAIATLGEGSTQSANIAAYLSGLERALVESRAVPAYVILGNGVLLRRWDAVNHHRELLTAPHHVHLPDGHVEGVAWPPDITAVLAQIEAQLAES
ncbi:MAG: hypothetical protein AUK03_01530 [Anaerolineae bacterium CG2_30_64_16]|nr:MAG: hypothetical protein AUK03_01530 [Anaerolineae bacterium CG2_30_64_16]